MKLQQLFDYLSEHLNSTLKLEVFQDYIRGLNINLDDIDKNNIVFKEDSYNRNLLYRNDKLEILVLCWNIKQGTPPHFHPDNGCILQVLQGKLKETVIKDNEKTKTINIFQTGDVSYMHNELGSHTIQNISPDCSISLHIYSPPRFYN